MEKHYFWERAWIPGRMYPEGPLPCKQNHIHAAPKRNVQKDSVPESQHHAGKSTGIRQMLTGTLAMPPARENIVGMQQHEAKGLTVLTLIDHDKLRNW